MNDFILAIPDRPDAVNTQVAATGRHRNEQPLCSWEEHLQTVLDNTPIMLTRCSSDLRYQFVSRACAQMFGREPEDFAGKSIIDIVGEEAFNHILPHIRRGVLDTQLMRSWVSRLPFSCRQAFKMKSRGYWHASSVASMSSNAKPSAVTKMAIA
jgi:PAS domain-containing protein